MTKWQTWSLLLQTAIIYIGLIGAPVEGRDSPGHQPPQGASTRQAASDLNLIFRRTNITAYSGELVFLPCEVPHFLEEEVQVSWVRRKDWHILTSGLQSYTTVPRFRVHHSPQHNEWNLAIKYVTLSDAGTYECQMVDSTKSLSHLVDLRVNSAIATIPGNGEYHVNQDSTIYLQCYINYTSNAPQYVFWYHNNRMITFDRQRGGISVTIETSPRVRSRLTITRATQEDSGNYSCTAANTVPDSITVYITQVNQVAAVQPRSVGSVGSLLLLGPAPIVLLVVVPLALTDASRGAAYFDPH